MADDSATAHTVLLHGDLDLWIHEARRLPNMDIFTERLRRCFTPCRSVLPQRSTDGHHSHHPHSKVITSDPYVTVMIAGATVARTGVIPNSQSPVWNEHFHIPVAHSTDPIQFNVKDDDVFDAQLIGTLSVPSARIAAASVIDREWLPILGSNGKPPKPDSALLVSIRFTPMWENPEYMHGIDPGLLSEAHRGMEAFFAMPLFQKQRAQRRPGESCGYASSFTGRFSAKLLWKETLSFHFSPSSSVVLDYFIRTLGEDSRHFGEVYQDYCEAMSKLSLEIMEVLGMSLGFGRAHFRDFFPGNDSIMRLNYYPPCQKSELTLGTGSSAASHLIR